MFAIESAQTIALIIYFARQGLGKNEIKEKMHLNVNGFLKKRKSVFGQKNNNLSAATLFYLRFVDLEVILV